jgi:hypothetical protein
MRTLLTLALTLSTLSLSAYAPKKAEPVKPAPAAKAEAKPAPKAEAKPAPAAAFVGNKDSKTFHKADCKMAAKMKPENKVTFATKAEAEKAGFKPCKVCKP